MDPSMKRRYVWEQTAEWLREGIRDGVWSGFLPPERVLSEELRVSRDQLRLATARLRDEGVIEKSGRRHRVLGASESSAGKFRRVVVATPLPLTGASHLFLEVLGRLRDSLGRKGMPVHFRTVPALAGKRPERRLEELVETLPDAIWVVHHAERAAQEWFAGSGRPAVVLGTCWAGLSSVDLEHVAMARHCVGMLRRRLGNEPKVVLLRPDRELAGLAEVEQVMQDELSDFQVVMDRSDTGFKPSGTAQLKRSDVVITATGRLAVGVSGWLEREAGRRVGRDVSVISLSGSPVLQFAWPSIAHYTVDGIIMERRLRGLIDRLEKGRKADKSDTMMPEFVEGGSLAS